MSKIIELSDEQCDAITHLAERRGITLNELVAGWPDGRRKHVRRCSHLAWKLTI